MEKNLLEIQEEKISETQELQTHKNIVEEEMENVDCELISKRESNVKHYKMKDNTFRAVFFEDDVHYWDSEKQCYEEIDNTLERKTDLGQDCFVTQSGAYKARFGVTADSGNLFKIERHGCSASWRFGELKNEEVSKLRVAKSAARVQTAQKNKSYISYDNIFSGVDLEYTAEPYRVKENIIIRQKQTRYNYLLYFAVEGAIIEINSEGGLNINNKETGETEFQMPAPFMIDSENRRSDDVYYEIEKTDDNGNYTLRIVASEKWINSEERSLPVRIDPQILIPRLEIEQTLYTYNHAPKENEPTETWENFKESVTYIGRKDNRTYKRYINFKLANSSALLSNVTIKDVLIQTTIVNDTGLIVNMRPFTLDSKGDINWTGDTIDFRRIKRDDNENAKATVYHFDYTGRLNFTEKITYISRRLRMRTGNTSPWIRR